METYVYLSYEYDPNKEKYGVGFFVSKTQLEIIKQIAKNNKMFLIVEEEFNFVEDEQTED